MSFWNTGLLCYLQSIAINEVCLCSILLFAKKCRVFYISAEFVKRYVHLQAWLLMKQTGHPVTTVAAFPLFPVSDKLHYRTTWSVLTKLHALLGRSEKLNYCSWSVQHKSPLRIGQYKGMLRQEKKCKS